MAGLPPHEPRRAAQHARRAELEGQLPARDAASAGKAGPHPSGRLCPVGQDLRPAIRPHLVQGRAVCQVGSRASGNRPASLNAGSHGRDFGGGTRHGTTEQRHGSSGAGEQGQSQRETAGSPGRHLAGGRGGVTRYACYPVLFCNGRAVEQLADRSTLLEPKVRQDDSDAEFWLSGLSLSVLFGTDVFLCGVAVYNCCECSDLYESSL